MTQHEQENVFDYKATESMLRFMSKIFKSLHSQELLFQDVQGSFHLRALQDYFQPILKNYRSLNFCDASSMGDLISSIQKLTYRLLDHFVDIPRNLKAPLEQPYPRFNLLLEIFTGILNQCPLDKLCSEPLELIQVKQGSAYGLNNLTKLENKFLQEAITSKNLSSRKYLKVANMIGKTLQTLNKLIQLVLVDEG